MEILEQNLRVKDICKDIEENEIDLKPEFQRGEVWTSAKKKLLIDSILRDWHIPPIHIVQVDGGKQEVLDGQQRLAAIRDFLDNKFAIDGAIQPCADEISVLNKMRYRDLPQEIKRSVDRYSLKVYVVKNYLPGEPNELFHRLNQTVKLTSAETRNSIFGDIRNDVSNLVRYMQDQGVDKDVIGFSNSRMAYNDLISRVAIYLEKNSIRYQLTDARLNERYRSDLGFSEKVKSSLEFAIGFMGYARINSNSNYDLNLTKASTLSWFYLLADLSFNNKVNEDDFSRIYESFIFLEVSKSNVRNNNRISSDVIDCVGLPEKVIRELLFLYIERSSSRVMSTGSILIRDVIINLFLFKSGLSVLDSSGNELISSLIDQLGLGSSVDVKGLVENSIEDWRRSDEAE